MRGDGRGVPAIAASAGAGRLLVCPLINGLRNRWGGEIEAGSLLALTPRTSWHKIIQRRLWAAGREHNDGGRRRGKKVSCASAMRSWVAWRENGSVHE